MNIHVQYMTYSILYVQKKYYAYINKQTYLYGLDTVS